jgi:ring-1,2-phenylacetyl-CoA epoxidase subunit PaaE
MTVTITEIIHETSDTKSFMLESSDGVIPYKAGQFLTFLFTSRTGKEVRRSYSISSSPELNEPLTITVKRIPNGEFSRRLTDKTRKGDTLRTIGASGFFVLPDNMSGIRRLIFFAAGSGIAPIFSLIKTTLLQHPHVEVLLIDSNPSPDKTIFYHRLIDLQKQFADKLTIEFLFSRSKDLLASRLSPVTLEILLKKHEVTDSPDILFYTCGPGGYMRMVIFTLITLGIDGSRIKKEIFHVQQPVQQPIPPDTKKHKVVLHLGDKQFTFEAGYPQTILQAARQHDIHIPYSCETGQCGTCVAKCLHGSVWMAMNEVLLDDEINKGIILTCTGYPVYGDVTLKI